MKEERSKLIAISIIEFIAFLVGYANAFYVVGRMSAITNGKPFMYSTEMVFNSPIYFFILTAISIYLAYSPSYKKWVYIVMGILSTFYMGASWIAYAVATSRGERLSIPLAVIINTILSILVLLIYIWIIVKIIVADHNIKKKSKENK